MTTATHGEKTTKKHHSNEEHDLLTVREVARRLRIDDTTVRRYIKNDVLEAVALPHRGNRQAYRIKRETLNKILETTATTE